MIVKKLSAEQWAPIAEQAHLVVFEKYLPLSAHRFDYVLVAEDETGTPLGYVLVREHSDSVVYWQFGGAFPSSKGTLLSFKVYEKFLDAMRERYAMVTTLIENTNLTMLKFAMKVGFRVIGVRFMERSILLEHAIKF